MIEETTRVYAIFPTVGNGKKIEKTINISEKKEYLNCKFWKETEEKARLVFNCYFHGILNYPSSENPKIVLSNLDCIYSNQETSRYTDNINSRHREKYDIVIKGKMANNSCFTKNLGTPTDISRDHLELIRKDYGNSFEEKIKNNALIIKNKNNEDEKLYLSITNEELAGWYKDKINKEPINEKIIAHFKTKEIFANEDKINKNNIKIIRPILESPLFCLTYKDAKDLFFSKHEILAQLKEAVDKKEIRGFYTHDNDYVCYFLVRDLLKWLMNHNYLENWLENEFEDLKIESFKSNSIKEKIFNVERFSELLHEKIGNHMGNEFNVSNKLDEFEDSLKKILKGSLDKQCGVEVLLSLAAGFKLKEIYSEMLEKQMRILGEEHKKPVTDIPQNLRDNHTDEALKKSIAEVILIANNSLKNVRKEEPEAFKLPVEWVKFFEGNYNFYLMSNYRIIPHEMDVIIKANYFGIDEKRGEDILKEYGDNTKTYHNTLSFKQLSEKLNLTEEKTITYILDSDIGVYIKKDSNFKIGPYLESKRKIGKDQDKKKSFEDKEFGKRCAQPIPLIEDEFKNYSYDYPFYGHVRLAKHPRDTDYWGDNVQFSHFYKGDCIENASKGVPLERSLAEACLGFKRIIKLEKNQKITLDDLVFFEDEVDTWISKFDRQNFYSEHNAKIIEEILNKQRTSLNEIFSVGIIESALQKQEIFNNLKNEIAKWEKRDKNKYGYQYILFNKEEVNHPFMRATEILSDFLLSFLIRKEFLPIKLCRLVGFTENQTFFYENFPDIPLKESDCAAIINSSENIKPTPTIRNYNQVLADFRKKGISKMLLLKAIKENKVGIYIEVEERFITTNSLIGNVKQSIEYFCQLNCGNPNYLKRYEGLERLPIKDNISGFKAEDFIHRKNFIINAGKIQLQCTDVETKLYIFRELKSFNGKNEIKLIDLVFLVEEIEKIESGENIAVIEEVKKIDNTNIQEQINQNIPFDDDQLLSRSAVTKNYTKLSDHAWDKIFAKEKENTLIDAKTRKGSTKQRDRYSKCLVEKWLIENGYYTIKQIKELN